MLEIVNQNYRLLALLGKGSFGKIYLAFDLKNQAYIALKIEKKEKEGYLCKEALLYEALRGTLGIPTIFEHGYDSESQFLAMELLGHSVEELYIQCNNRLSLKTTLLLADQMIERLQQVHERGILHRDIKSHNFVMGIAENTSLVYLLDFGLAKAYRKGSEHVRYREDKHMIGTVRYASINNQRGVQQSRRDDLESLGYVLVYLVNGGLPWQGIQESSKRLRKALILDKKLKTSLECLCMGLPGEFINYISYTRSLEFEETPNYAYLKRIFKNLFIRMNFQYDFLFDWKALGCKGDNQDQGMSID